MNNTNTIQDSICDKDVTVYLIPGKKVGSTNNLKRRMAQQGFSVDDCEVLEVIPAGTMTYRSVWIREQALAVQNGFGPEHAGNWQTFYRQHTNPCTNDPAVRAKLSEAKSNGAVAGKNNPMYGKELSAEHKARISAAHKGKVISEETRAKMSAAKSGSNHPFYGKTHSEETLAKLSASKVGSNHPQFGRTGKLSPTAKSANVYCYATHELLAEDVVLAEYARENDYNPGNLSGTATGRLKQTKGIYARYQD